MFSASLPDHYETFRPKLDNPNEPTVAGKEPGTFEANEKYKNVPGAVLRLGNLPRFANASVHSGEDVILTATGPGSERVRGQMDNTDVFRVMVEALGLGQVNRTTGAASQNDAKSATAWFDRPSADCTTACDDELVSLAALSRRDRLDESAPVSSVV